MVKLDRTTGVDLKPNLMGQTDKSNSRILQSSQSETVNLWEHLALKSFGFAIQTFCRILMCKTYTLKKHNTQRIDKSGHMLYVDGQWWKKKIRNSFFDSFYISFQFLPTFSWFRILRSGRGGGKNANTLKPLKKEKIDSQQPLTDYHYNFEKGKHLEDTFQ